MYRTRTLMLLKQLTLPQTRQMRTLPHRTQTTTKRRTDMTNPLANSAAPAAVPPVCPAPDGSTGVRLTFDGPQPFCIDLTRSYTAVFDTSEGVMRFALHAQNVPYTVNNFVTLAPLGLLQQHSAVPHRSLHRHNPGRGTPHQHRNRSRPWLQHPRRACFRHRPVRTASRSISLRPGAAGDGPWAGPQLCRGAVLHHHGLPSGAFEPSGHLRGIRQHRRRRSVCCPVDHRPACAWRESGWRSVKECYRPVGHH